MVQKEQRFWNCSETDTETVVVYLLTLPLSFLYDHGKLHVQCVGGWWGWTMQNHNYKCEEQSRTFKNNRDRKSTENRLHSPSASLWRLHRCQLSQLQATFYFRIHSSRQDKWQVLGWELALNMLFVRNYADQQCDACAKIYEQNLLAAFTWIESAPQKARNAGRFQCLPVGGRRGGISLLSRGIWSGWGLGTGSWLALPPA